MTESNNDDAAEALAKFAEGDVAPSEVLPGEPSEEEVEPVEQPEPVEQEAIPEGEIEVPAVPIMQRPPQAPQHRVPVYQTTNFRQTIIPILLTCGILTLIFASLKTFLGPDSVFGDLPGWVPISLFAGGFVLLFLAIINMFAVKRS